MDIEKTHGVSEVEAREVAEASRQKEWRKPSFMKEMFLGNFRIGMVYPFPNHGNPNARNMPSFAESSNPTCCASWIPSRSMPRATSRRT